MEDRPGLVHTFWCCLQGLAPLMMKALFLPCFNSAQETPESAEQPGLSRVGTTPLNVHRVRYKLLSIIPSLVKSSSDSSWFWSNATPHCSDWLGGYVDWMIDAGKRSTLDIGPYLGIFGEQRMWQMPSCSTSQAFLGHVNVCLCPCSCQQDKILASLTSPTCVYSHLSAIPGHSIISHELA